MDTINLQTQNSPNLLPIFRSLLIRQRILPSLIPFVSHPPSFLFCLQAPKIYLERKLWKAALPLVGALSVFSETVFLFFCLAIATCFFPSTQHPFFPRQCVCHNQRIQNTQWQKKIKLANSSETSNLWLYNNNKQNLLILNSNFI